ncbi:MAG: hypothetical protein ACXADY_19500 [Candidatus Hodarchaeales archaeon]|jgi:hypothetical protein
MTLNNLFLVKVHELPDETASYDRYSLLLLNIRKVGTISTLYTWLTIIAEEFGQCQ